MIKLFPQFGAPSTGESLRRIKASPNFNGRIFVNQIPTPMRAEGVNYRELFGLMLKKDRSRTPDATGLNTLIPTPEILRASRGAGGEAGVSPVSKLKTQNSSFLWFGHSTLLLNLHNTLILTDPVFSKRASPFSFSGPKAFPGSTPYSVEDLPDPDIILLSHDHYDHLDYKTIKKIHSRTGRFIVPLGVGAHLKHWGVDPAKITELDWWEQITIESAADQNPDNRIQLTCTPQRHFSGRGIRNRNTTLWCSWVIESQNAKVFWGADGGYSPVFKEIGDKFGGFDLSLLECGAYSKYWPNIHSLPEETVQAHIDLNAKTLIPIHWGKFNLSIHPWREPIERIATDAERRKVILVIPEIGKEEAIGEK